MSWVISRQLSRERARSDDVREGRKEALRELVIVPEASASSASPSPSPSPAPAPRLNWVAVSQLLSMVQHRGAIPDSARRALKGLLASSDPGASLHALTILDLLALNCPGGRVRQQLAGSKWVRKLGARSRPGGGGLQQQQGFSSALRPAVIQLLVNWSVVFEGHELGEAAAAQCKALEGYGVALPAPPALARSLAADVWQQDPARPAGRGGAGEGGGGRSRSSPPSPSSPPRLLQGLDFASEFLRAITAAKAAASPAPVLDLNPRLMSGSSAGMPPTPTLTPGPDAPAALRKSSSFSLHRASDLPASGAAKATQQPPHRRTAEDLAGAGAAVAPAVSAWGSPMHSVTAHRSAAYAHGLRSPSPSHTPCSSAPGSAAKPDPPALSADDECHRRQLEATVHELLWAAKREKKKLAAADDAFRKTIVRQNAGQNWDGPEVVIRNAEAGCDAATDCKECAEQIKELVNNPDLTSEMLSSLLTANDALASQLRRWHALLSNPVVQAALAGPVAASSADNLDCGSPPRSMHLLDLPGVYSTPFKRDAPGQAHLRRGMSALTAPSSPSERPLKPLDGGPCSVGASPAHHRVAARASQQQQQQQRFNFPRHTRSVSSPDNRKTQRPVLDEFDPAAALEQVPPPGEAAEHLQPQLAEDEAESAPVPKRSWFGASPFSTQSPRCGAASVETPSGSSTGVAPWAQQGPSRQGSGQAPAASTLSPSSTSVSGSTSITPQEEGAGCDFSRMSSDHMSVRSSPPQLMDHREPWQALERRASDSGSVATAAPLQHMATVRSLPQPLTGTASLLLRPSAGRSHQEQVAALQQQIENLLDQLAEAWQVKATAQREVALHHSALIAAEAEAEQLREELAAERDRASREIRRLQEALRRANAGEP